MDEEYTPKHWLRLSKAKLISLISLAIVLGSGVAVASLLLADKQAPKVIVPAAITKEAGFAVHVPTVLPGNYTIDPDSFVLGEENSVVSYRAKDASGTSIIFTEQKRPAKFNFTTFYKQQMKDAITLDGVPYTSVVGKSAINDSQVLSVVTNDTWLLVTTEAPLSAGDLRVIAQSL